MQYGKEVNMLNKITKLQMLQLDAINKNNVQNLDELIMHIKSFFKNQTETKFIKMLDYMNEINSIFYLSLSYNIDRKKFIFNKVMNKKDPDLFSPLIINHSKINQTKLLETFHKYLIQNNDEILIEAYFELMNDTITTLNLALYQFFLDDTVRINYQDDLNIPKKYFVSFPNHKRTKCIESLLVNIRSLNFDTCTNINVTNDSSLSYSEAYYAFNDLKSDDRDIDWSQFFITYIEVLGTKEFMRTNYDFILKHSNVKQMYQEHYEKVKDLLYHHFSKKRQLLEWENIFIHKNITIKTSENYFFYAQSPYQNIRYNINIDNLFDVIKNVPDADEVDFENMLRQLSDFFDENEIFLKNKDQFFNHIKNLKNKKIRTKKLLSLENKVQELREVSHDKA